MTTALLAAALFAAIHTQSTAGAPDPCQLVTAAEIRAAFGGPVSTEKRSGPHAEKETGATLTSCTRQLGEKVLDVSVGEFPSAAEADKAMTTLSKIDPSDADEAKMLPASGVGDRSLFGATKIGAHWFVQKGRFTVSVTLAGELGNGAQHKETLKKLAAAAIARL